MATRDHEMSNAELAQEIERTIDIYEQLIGQRATRTRSMIERYGQNDALSRLMVSADLQKGFKVLRDRGRLDDSFEALVVRYEGSFSREAVEAARWRLERAQELI